MNSSIRNCNCRYFPPAHAVRPLKETTTSLSPIFSRRRRKSFSSASSNYTLGGLAFPIAPRPIFICRVQAAHHKDFETVVIYYFWRQAKEKVWISGPLFFWCGLSVACLWVPFLVLLFFFFAWLVEQQGASERDASEVHHQ